MNHASNGQVNERDPVLSAGEVARVRASVRLAIALLRDLHAVTESDRVGSAIQVLDESLDVLARRAS